MKANVFFFAARNDLLEPLERFEERHAVDYVRTGHFPTTATRRIRRVAEIPQLGIAEFASSAACRSFLVLERDADVVSRPITYLTGEQVFAIDQLLNPNTITLRPAGEYGSEAVLQGTIATASDSQVARDLLEEVRSAVLKAFTRIDDYYVGPIALRYLRDGRRLTLALQSPTEFDLRAPS